LMEVMEVLEVMVTGQVSIIKHHGAPRR
jgi:hypothetical protein